MSLERHLVVLLQHMYVTERDYQMYLCEWAGKVKDQQLKSAVNAQLQGIGGELDGLRQCLGAFGATPNEDVLSPMVKSLMELEQGDQADFQNASPTDMDVHLALTDVSFGNAEIGLYQAMLTMARTLKRQDIAGILETILQHEANDLQQMTDILNVLINLSQQQQKAA